MAQFKKQTKKITVGTIAGTAFLLMGLSMPSCPGQQETERKIQDVTAKVTAAERSVSTQSEKVKALENEVGDLKKALQEVAEVLKTHKNSIDELTAKVGELAASKGGAKKAGGKRH